jgi:hypothetical protein
LARFTGDHFLNARNIEGCGYQVDTCPTCSTHGYRKRTLRCLSKASVAGSAPQRLGATGGSRCFGDNVAGFQGRGRHGFAEQDAGRTDGAGRAGAGAVVPADDQDGLRDAIHHLLTDPLALRRARQGARRCPVERTWHAGAAAHLALYQRLRGG